MFRNTSKSSDFGGGTATLIDGDMLETTAGLDLEEAIRLQAAEGTPQKVIQILRCGEIVATRSYGDVDWGYKADERRA